MIYNYKAAEDGCQKSISESGDGNWERGSTRWGSDEAQERLQGWWHICQHADSWGSQLL